MPEWFKKCPAVLVDRDLVYRKEDLEKLKSILENPLITDEEKKHKIESFTSLSKEEQYSLKKFIQKDLTE